MSVCVGNISLLVRRNYSLKLEHLFIILHENVVKGEKRWGQGVNLTMHKINETNVILVMHVRFCDYLNFCNLSTIQLNFCNLSTIQSKIIHLLYVLNM